MGTPRLIAAALVLAVLAGLGVAAWNLSTATSPTDAVQVSREPGGSAAITISVTRSSEGVLEQPGLGPDLAAMRGHVLPFAIAVDTHGGDVTGLDLNGRVFIRDATGLEIPGIVRQLSAEDHHTTYVAVFPRLDNLGRPLDGPTQGELRMIIRGVGSLPERVLTWHLQPLVPAGLAGFGRMAAGAVALVALLGGFLALLSPCVLHTTSYWVALVTGCSSQEDLANNTPPALRAGVVRTVLLYIAGFTTMYVVLGTLAGTVGSLASHTLSDRLAPYKLVLDVIAGIFMALFGLHVLGLWRAGWVHRLRLPLPKFLQPRWGSAEKPAAFTMGLSMAVGCVSCVGGTVFLGLLAYLGTTTWYTGLQVSVLYSLGLALPLLLLTFGLGRWLTALRSHPRLRQGMAIASGAVLVTVGMLTLVGHGELVESALFWAVARGSALAGGHVH